MIITDDFVMINFPKTGSSFAREVIKKLYADKPIEELMLPKVYAKINSKILAQHGTVNQIPLIHKHKPIVSITRNPFLRYKSLYFYGWWKKNPPVKNEIIKQVFPHFPNLSFAEYYEMAHIFGRDNELNDAVPKIELGMHTIQFIQFYFKNPKNILNKIDNNYIENKKYVNDIVPTYFIHQENLVNELKDFLSKIGFPESELAFIDSMGKINVSDKNLEDEVNNELMKGTEIYKKIIEREKLLFSLFPEYLSENNMDSKTVTLKKTDKRMEVKNNKTTNITLSMIVKNEEEYLRGCLESVKDVVDEIVIVDTGSTDKTLEIAKEFNAKIYHFEWIKDFSAARNFALSKSTGNWILYLDADERIEPKSKKEILRLTKDNKKLGINCIINNLDDNKNAPTLMKYVRLFRNSKNISFIGKAHEQIESSLLKQGYKIIDSTIEIIHLGYNVSKEKLKVKAERNLELLLNEYNENPTSYGAYQIANSYSVLDDIEQSIYYTKKTLEYKNLRKEFKSVCYLRIADYELQKGNLLYAKEIIDKGIYGDRNHPLMNLLASQIYKQFNKKEEAINFCKNALKQNLILAKKNKSKNVLDIVIDSKSIIYQGMILSLEMGNISELQYFLEKLKRYDSEEYRLFIKILQNKDFDRDLLNKLTTRLDEKNLEVVLKLMEVNPNNNIKLEFYSGMYDRLNKNTKFIMSFGSFLMNIGQLEEAEIILRTSLDNNYIDPAIIFYLISIYVQKGELDKVRETISKGEQLAKNNKTLQNKLDEIKNKLAPILEASLL